MLKQSKDFLFSFFFVYFSNGRRIYLAHLRERTSGPCLARTEKFLLVTDRAANLSHPFLYSGREDGEAADFNNGI